MRLNPLYNILLLITVPMIGTSDSVIALWDFGPDDNGYTEQVTINNTIGTPTLSGMAAGSGYDTNGQDGIPFVNADGAIHNAGQALTWGSGVNDGDQEWIMTLDLTGYQNVALRWDYRSTSTGPTNAVFDYRINSGNWTQIEEITLIGDSAFHAYDKDLTSITAINDQPSVEFRLSGFAGGSGSGTHRIDNLQVTAIPEPAVIGFVTLAALGGLIGKRLFA